MTFQRLTVPGQVLSVFSKTGAILAASVLALGLMIVASGTAKADDCSVSGVCYSPSCTGDQATSANWCTEPLYLHGGTVQHDPRIYLIFWGPKWNEAPYNGYASFLANDVFGKLRGTAFNNILVQYSDANGPVNNDVVLAGSSVDVSTPPPVTEAEIIAEIDNVVAAKSWTATADTQFIVFPQTGSDDSALGNGCGRHFMRQAGASGTAAWVVYPTDQPGCSSGSDEGDLTKYALHEYAEAATDPQGLDYSLVPTNTHGYATDDPHTDPIEVADKCQGYAAQSESPPGFPDVSLPLLWSPAAGTAGACTIMHGADFPTPAPGWSYHTVYGPILDKYSALGSTSSALGEPVSEEQGVSTGRVSYFAGASCGGGGPDGSGSAIYWTSGLVAHEVQGCIYHDYIVTGGPAVLGFPMTDEVPARLNGVGRENLFSGTTCGAATGSAILYTATTGAHEVQGCIYQDYKLNNGPDGSLGFPVTDEEAVPNTNGRVSYFSGTGCTSGPYQDANGGSAIFWSPATQAHEVKGCIFQTYIQHWSGPYGALGFPAGGENAVTGGSYNTFAGTSCASGPYRGNGSALVWNAAAGAAYKVQGCIYQMYSQSENGPGGAVGLPVNDETPVTGGSYNKFTGTSCSSGPYQGKGATIVWNAAAGSPYEVQGCIFQLYDQAKGGPSGTLGVPTSSETPVSGGSYNTFAGTSCTSGGYVGSGSAIVWNAGNGSPYELQGCIWQTYRQAVGGPGGAYGLPTSSETPVSGGSYNTFAGTSCTSGTYQGHGSAIVWNAAAGGAYTVQGCIYQLYLQKEGGIGGAFGLPTSGERNIVSGYSGVTGRVNTFTGTNCTSDAYNGSGSAIYWNPVAGSAYEVQGCIYQGYLQGAGGASGPLGLPISSEVTIDSAGDRESTFEHGHIIWYRATDDISITFG